MRFSDTEWKKNLKLPAKDMRQKTEVSTVFIAGVCFKRVCLQPVVGCH